MLTSFLLRTATVSILSTLFCRFIVFPLSVVDWDESVYSLMANDIISGILPMNGLFDHKPVGLFYIFAGIQILFEDDVAAIRILGILAVAISSFLIGLILYKRLSIDPVIAYLCSGLYPVFTAVNGGLATNTEILMNAFILVVIWLSINSAVSERSHHSTAVLIGLVCAIIFQVNYIGAFAIVGLAALYCSSSIGDRTMSDTASFVFRAGLFVGAGFILGNGLILAPTFIFGDPVRYFGEQFAFLSGYGVVRGGLLNWLGFNVVYTLRHLIPLVAPVALVTTLVVVWIQDRRLVPRGIRHVVVGLLLLVAFCYLGAFVTGRIIDHYLLLMVPGLLLLSGVALSLVPPGIGRRMVSIWLAILGIMGIWNSEEWIERGARAYAAILTNERADIPAQIANDIRPCLGVDGTVYVFDYHHVIYTLVGVSPPTRYPLTLNLTNPQYADAIGVDPTAEIKAVFDQSPRFVVLTDLIIQEDGNPAVTAVRAQIDKDFALETTYVDPVEKEKIHLYRRHGTEFPCIRDTSNKP